MYEATLYLFVYQHHCQALSTMPATHQQQLPRHLYKHGSLECNKVFQTPLSLFDANWVRLAFHLSRRGLNFCGCGRLYENLMTQKFNPQNFSTRQFPNLRYYGNMHCWEWNDYSNYSFHTLLILLC